LSNQRRIEAAFIVPQPLIDTQSTLPVFGSFNLPSNIPGNFRLLQLWYVSGDERRLRRHIKPSNVWFSTNTAQNVIIFMQIEQFIGFDD
jgi:hypothetical protein